MAQEPMQEPQIQVETEKPRREHRALAGLASLALLVVLVLVVLLLPRCSGGGDSAGGGRGKRIVAVPDAPAEPGVVSVWIDADSSIDDILGKAQLEDSEATDLGGGRFVVNVKPGTERDSARRLQEIPGVYDAGFVFTDEADKPGE